MRVYVAWHQYGEEVIGVYSDHDKAMEAIGRKCTHPHPSDKGKHGDRIRCGIFDTVINEEIK